MGKVNDITNFDIKQKCKLSIPIRDCGHILFKNYIIIFGGQSRSGYLDSIYLLNLNKKNDGWKQLSVKCPILSHYIAVLAPDNTVHIITRYNKDNKRGHYSLSISAIMGDEYFDAGDDDEDNEDDNKCVKCDSLKTKLNKIITAKQTTESLVNELMQKYEELREENDKLKQENNELKLRLNKSEKERNEAIQDCKESNLALNEIRDELLSLRQIHLNPLFYNC